LNGNLCGFLVANFADHDFVRIVRKMERRPRANFNPFFRLPGICVITAKLISTGSLNGDNFVFVVLISLIAA